MFQLARELEPRGEMLTGMGILCTALHTWRQCLGFRKIRLFVADERGRQRCAAQRRGRVDLKGSFSERSLYLSAARASNASEPGIAHAIFAAMTLNPDRLQRKNIGAHDNALPPVGVYGAGSCGHKC